MKRFSQIILLFGATIAAQSQMRNIDTIHNLVTDLKDKITSDTSKV